jgi:PKD repeat protein
MRLLTAVSLACLTAACGVDAPSTTPTALPAHGAPSKIELSATPGTGEHGGSATVTARVMDAYASVLPEVAVTFGATAGTLSEATVATNSNGVAATTLSADPGTVKVTAAAGAVSSPEISVAIQPVNVFVPPPVVPPPVVPPTPTPDVPFTVTINAAPAGAGLSTAFGMSGPVQVTSASWTFGDGATGVSSGPNTAHVYATVGTFPVNVVATDSRGRTASASTSVVIPAGSFTVTLTPSPASVAIGTAVTLTAAATPVNTPLTPTAFAWDCGDGSAVTTDALTTHQCTYAALATVTPRVTVSNGTITGTASTSVTVTAQPAPVVTVNCGTVTAGATTTCNVSAKVNGVTVPSSSITSVTWDFGDSTPTTTVASNTTTHTYAGASTYTVIVTNVTVTGTTTKGSGSGTAVVN